jgi:hypothetical protein
MTPSNAAILQADSAIVDCKVRVVIAHDAGCALMASQGFATSIYENPWVLVLGIVLILGGPLIALWGEVFTRLISPPIAFGLGTFVMIYDFYNFGWMKETCGIVLSTIFAVAVGLVWGFYCWYNKKFASYILGGICGYFVGSTVILICLTIGCNLICENFTFGIVLGALFTLCGMCAGYKWPNFMVHLSTSGIGAYIFMRGWTCIFGGYPSIKETIWDILDGVDPSLNYALWIYTTLFVFFWAGSYWFQHNKLHDYVIDTDDYWQKFQSEN